MFLENKHILEINLYGDHLIQHGCLEVIIMIYGLEKINNDHVQLDGMFQRLKNGISYWFIMQDTIHEIICEQFHYLEIHIN